MLRNGASAVTARSAASNSASMSHAKRRSTTASVPRATFSSWSRSNRSCIAVLFGIMKDDAERITVTAAHSADAVTQVDAVAAPDAAHRAMVDGEDHIAAPQQDHGGTRLHARPLLGQDEL